MKLLRMQTGFYREIEDANWSPILWCRRHAYLISKLPDQLKLENKIELRPFHTWRQYAVDCSEPHWSLKARSSQKMAVIVGNAPTYAALTARCLTRRPDHNKKLDAFPTFFCLRLKSAYIVGW